MAFTEEQFATQAGGAAANSVAKSRGGWTTPGGAVTQGPNNGYNGGNNNNSGGGRGNNNNNNPKPKPKPKPKPPTTSFPTQVVPGRPNKNNPGQINVVDYGSQIMNDPSLFLRKDDPNTPFNESMWMSQRGTSQAKIQEMINAGLIDPNDPKYQMDPGAMAIDVENMMLQGVDPRQTNTYDVATSYDQVASEDMEAAQGQVSDQALVEAEQADMQGLATGINADGSTNYVGQALSKYATQNFGTIIDTSTSAGKLLAQQLGEGNYLDSKATLKGQLEILQSEFVDPETGEPRIPSWAAGTARNVSKIAAFKGMSGTAATAAMSQALLEASLPIAQQESQFFQTLTLQNLTNKQQSIINTANVLARFEEVNLDNRMAAAVQNAKAFLDMDLKNLDNEQQSRVINYQARIQSILEDSKQENAKRLFVAESQNEMDRFYDELNIQIAKYNSTLSFDANKFNAEMEDSRERFYKEMQFEIDVSNAKWRQAIELNEDAQAHESASIDVRNMFDIAVGNLNRIWDRSDSLLDYAWNSGEKENDRRAAIALELLRGKMAAKLEEQKAWGSLMGLAVSDILNLNGNPGGSSILGLFGF